MPVFSPHVDDERQCGQHWQPHTQHGAGLVTPPPVPFRQRERRRRYEPPEEGAERARHEPESPDVTEHAALRPNRRFVLRLVGDGITQRDQQAQHDDESRKRQRESINLAES